MKVIIAEYSPDWPRLFEQEMRLLEIALGKDTTIIEQVGSTSVVGLPAKPIIDIMVGLYDFSMADNLVPKVEALGYEYMRQSEAVVPYRRYFTKRIDGIETHHIYMVAVGGGFWEGRLLFRNCLRENPATANEYAALKKKLAELEWNDIDEYSDAKNVFIRRVEKEARGQRLQPAQHNNPLNPNA